MSGCAIRRIAVPVLLTAACGSGPATTRRIAGCYDLAVGPYAPSVGADSVYFAPPRHVELTAEPAADSLYRIALPALVHGGAPGSWRARGDSIAMIWTDGTTGVAIAGIVRHDSILGIARPVSDVVVPDAMRATAPVTGWRVACAKR